MTACLASQALMEFANPRHDMFPMCAVYSHKQAKARVSAVQTHCWHLKHTAMPTTKKDIMFGPANTAVVCVHVGHVIIGQHS